VNIAVTFAHIRVDRPEGSDDIGPKVDRCVVALTQRHPGDACIRPAVRSPCTQERGFAIAGRRRNESQFATWIKHSVETFGESRAPDQRGSKGWNAHFGHKQRGGHRSLLPAPIPRRAALKQHQTGGLRHPGSGRNLNTPHPTSGFRAGSRPKGRGRALRRLIREPNPGHLHSVQAASRDSNRALPGLRLDGIQAHRWSSLAVPHENDR